MISFFILYPHSFNFYNLKHLTSLKQVLTPALTRVGEAGRLIRGVYKRVSQKPAFLFFVNLIFSYFLIDLRYMDKLTGENLSPTGFEQKEKEPKISYHFFFAPHATAEDAKNLEQAFQEADIFVPEAYAHTPATLELTRDIADGRINPKDVFEDSFLFQIGKIFYNSHKPIILVDISKGDDAELLRQDDQADRFINQALELFANGEFDRALIKAEEYADLFSRVQLQREEIIKNNLKVKIKEFVEEHPEYGQKEEVRVLVSLGSAHTSLYRDLKQKGLSVSREFNESPAVCPSLIEAHRRKTFDRPLKNKKDNDELLVRGMLEYFLEKYLKTRTNNTNKINRVSRIISSQLSFNDIKKVSDDFAKSEQINIFLELKKFNIHLPKSEQEMDEMLGIKKQ